MAGKLNGIVRSRLGLVLSTLADDETTLDILLQGASAARLEPGQFLFQMGELCETFLISLSGVVRVQLSSASGREVTLYRVTPGNSCCVTTSCLLDRGAYPAEGVAETSVEAIMVTGENFHKALARSADFRQFVFDGYSPILNHIISKVEQLSFMSIDTRLSNVLLDLHAKGEERVTHRELAGELGTAREVVSRKLKQFEIAGLIRLARGRIMVSDRSGLLSLGESSFWD